jgi:hypothetical protein
MLPYSVFMMSLATVYFMDTEEQYQPLPVLARAMDRDANYLGLLARQGKLEARKRGGRWYSTEGAVRRYAQQGQEGVMQRGWPRRSTHRG